MSSLMIVSAAVTSSVAKFPCVTTTPPISGINPQSGQWAVGSGQWAVGGGQPPAHRPLPTNHCPLFLHVPMHHPRVLLIAGEMLTDRIRHGYRAMSASGAPDPDGDIALAFALVERQQEIEQFAEAANGFARFLALIQIFNDRLVVAVHVFQLGDEM